VVLYAAQTYLAGRGMHYVVVLVLIGGAYALAALGLYGRRLLKALKNVNKITK
jgi:hypothetical protein